MKITITEIKNRLEEINSRLDDTEEHISELEDSVLETTEAEQKKRKIIKRNDSLRDLCNNIKHTNIHMLVCEREGEEGEKGAENIFEDIIAESFPNVGKKQISKARKDRESQTESTQRGPHQDKL